MIDPRIIERTTTRFEVYNQHSGKSINFNESIFTTIHSTVLQISRCSDLTFQLPPKINSLSIDSCSHIAVDCRSIITTLEVTNCTDLLLLINGSVHTITLDLSETIRIVFSKALAVLKTRCTVVTSSQKKQNKHLIAFEKSLLCDALFKKNNNFCFHSSTSGVSVATSDSSWRSDIPDVWRTIFSDSIHNLQVAPAEDFGAISHESISNSALILSSAITIERLSANSPIAIIDSFVVRSIIDCLLNERAWEVQNFDRRLLPAQKIPVQHLSPIRNGNTLIIENVVHTPTRYEPYYLDCCNSNDNLVVRKCGNLQIVLANSKIKTLTVENCIKVSIGIQTRVTNGTFITGCRNIDVEVSNSPFEEQTSAIKDRFCVSYSSSVQLNVPQETSEIITRHASTVNLVGNSLPGGELAIPEQFSTLIEHPSTDVWTSRTKILRRP